MTMLSDKPAQPAEPSDEALIPKTTYGDQRDIRSDIAEAKEHVSAVDEENHRLKQRIAELEADVSMYQVRRLDLVEAIDTLEARAEAAEAALDAAVAASNVMGEDKNG